MDHAPSQSEPSEQETLHICLPLDLLVAANAAGIDISSVAEAALARAVNDVRLETWARDNADALTALNQVIDDEGLPLRDGRLF